LRRLGSLLYEALVIVAVVLIVVALFSFVTVAFPGLGLRRPVLLGLCFLALGSYFIYSWVHGQTLAMLAWRIRIVDAQGRFPTPGRACLRFVLGWVWVAPPLLLVAASHPYVDSFGAALSAGSAATFAWILVWAFASKLHPRQQFWHDALAGTRLESAPPKPDKASRPQPSSG
jgi:uncharacterized RDD family membrane protein YckC